MSFVDLAAACMHRRNELEARLNIFWEKCDHAIDDIKKLKMKTQGLVLQLNCDPAELKERFLNSMKQLDEYMYLITDFNLAMSKFDETPSLDYTPVQDSFSKPLIPSSAPLSPFNLIDALSEPAPSASTACANHCPPEKPKRVKIPKADQPLIVFSSTSSSEEVVSQGKIGMAVKEVQCELETELMNVKIEDPPTSLCEASVNLPPQELLEINEVYSAALTHIDGPCFWVITEDPDQASILIPYRVAEKKGLDRPTDGQQIEAYAINLLSIPSFLLRFMVEMTNFYKANPTVLSRKEIEALSYCAFYEEGTDCYYRGLFVNVKEDSEVAQIYIVDTGEFCMVPFDHVQPLHPRFCSKPPLARCCQLAGVDLVGVQNKKLMKKQEEFMNKYSGRMLKIKIDDNTSEFLGVYVILPTGETLNDLIVQEGLALPIDKPVEEEEQLPDEQIPDSNQNGFEITDCPEYDDPVEAVTGYKNRDEIDICKHYKGEPDKKCFKGSRCTKKHIMMHPEGWTLDRVPVIAKCKSLPLPAPDTWLRVLVTYVCHFDRVYVHLEPEQEEEPELPNFGVVLPPTTLEALVRDMNSPATRIAYKPLTMTPAPGEMVAALYPLDNKWYRARVISVTRADQSVELSYVDYGTVLWVKEDQLRQLEARHLGLPLQAVRCVLAGVRARSQHSQQWARAKKELHDMTMNKVLDAHVVARDYDEITVELFDEEGYSIAEQLAANDMVDLVEYTVFDDSNVTKKIIVP